MAIAHVQTTGKAGDSVASVTTDAITTTSGNLLHANLSYFGEFVSLTDSKGNTWETANAELHDPASGGNTRQLYAKNCLGGSGHTFTLTLSSGNFPTLSVTEISGVDAAAPLHQANGTLSSVAGTSHTSGNVTTTVPDCILVGLCGSGESGSFGNDADYVERFNIATGAAAEGLITSTRLVSATETNDFAPTTSSSNITMTQVAAYRITADIAASRFTYLGPGGYPLGRFAAPVSATIAGSASLVVTTAAAFTTQVAMAGAASLAVTTAGALTTAVQFSAAATATVTTTAALTTDLRFTGAATAVITATADLSVAPSTLAGAAALTITASANLATTALFAGTASLTVTTAANLTIPAVVVIDSPQFISVLITVTPVPIPTPVVGGHGRVLLGMWGRPGVQVIGRIPSPTP